MHEPFSLPRRTYAVWFILAALVVLGAGLRIRHADKNFTFGVDQFADIRLFAHVTDLIKSGEWELLPLRGQQGTYPLDLALNEQLVYNGALYTYIFAPLSMLVGNTPEGLMTLSMVMSVLAIPLAYGVGAALFQRRVGILCAVLVACSYKMSRSSRIFWTPTPLPLFTLLAFFAYANVLKGKVRFWPLLAFATAAASQMHNAGYFVPVFFSIALAVQRPSWPKAWRMRGLTISAFLLPLLPTIWTEITSGFVLVRSVGRASLSQTLVQYPSFGSGIAAGLRQWSNFMRTALGQLSTMHALETAWYALFALMTLALVMAAFTGIRNKVRAGDFFRSSWGLLTLWNIAFLPFPWIQATYYGYQVEPSSFVGLSLGVPIVLLGFAGILEVLFHHKRAYIGATALCLFIVLNILTTQTSLWEDKFGDHLYGQKKEVVELIARHTGVLPYSVYFLEDSRNGYELLYLFQNHLGVLPERFNGFPQWGSLALTNRPAVLRYTIVQKDFVHTNGIDAQWGSYIGGTEHLSVYQRTQES